MHRTAIASLKSISPYSTSRQHETPKKNGENPNDYESRTWREKVHATADGRIFIPPMAFKIGLDTAAQRYSKQIPGKGKSTYTKHFGAGVLVTDGLLLDARKDEVEGEWFWVHADGQRGSGKRVKRCFPVVRDWRGELAFHVLDDVITKDVFEETLSTAGSFVGIGRFRPENKGFYGRYAVEKIRWE